MDLKWIGVMLIVTGCGGVGFLMAMYDRREMESIKQLLYVLDYMISELGYRMTPLPELCRRAATHCKGSLRSTMNALAVEMESQISPDVACCVNAALAKVPDLPGKTAALMGQLGATLGIFDLQGQIRGLEAVREDCIAMKNGMEVNRTQRLRSYQTLGLCAGTAIAILFL